VGRTGGEEREENDNPHHTLARRSRVDVLAHWHHGQRQVPVPGEPSAPER